MTNARELIESYLNSQINHQPLNEAVGQGGVQSIGVFPSNINNRNYSNHPVIKKIEDYLSDVGLFSGDLEHPDEFGGEDDYLIMPNDPELTDFEGDEILLYSLSHDMERVIGRPDFKKLARSVGLVISEADYDDDNDDNDDNDLTHPVPQQHKKVDQFLTSGGEAYEFYIVMEETEAREALRKGIKPRPGSLPGLNWSEPRIHFVLSRYHVRRWLRYTEISDYSVLEVDESGINKFKSAEGKLPFYYTTNPIPARALKLTKQVFTKARR